MPHTSYGFGAGLLVEQDIDSLCVGQLGHDKHKYNTNTAGESHIITGLAVSTYPWRVRCDVNHDDVIMKFLYCFMAWNFEKHSHAYLIYIIYIQLDKDRVYVQCKYSVLD